MNRCERENIEKKNFTTVFWGEKINLNIFSLPFIGERKYILIFFHHRNFGGENIFKFIITTIFLGEKINLNLFSLPFIGE